MEDKLIDNVKGESQPHPESRRVTLPSASAPQAEEPSVSGVSYRRSHTAPLLSTSDQETYKDLYKDIESLKNIDFIKTYSRLRRPQGLKTMSTTTSPIGSPTLISPTADTGNVGISSGRRLNRSLSLKLLTERLKSGRPPTEASSCKPSTRETPTRDFSQTSAFGTLRRVFPKKSRNMSELVTTRPDTPHATDPKVTSETEEGDAKEQSSDKSTVIDSDGDKRQQSNTTEEGRESPLCEAQPEDISPKEEEDKKTFVSSCVLGMPQTKDTKSTGNTDDSSEKVTKKGGDLSEDEGVESGDQTSVKSVDSKVPASQRPQRRSGAASLAMSGKVQEMFANLAAGDENQGDSGKQDEQTPRRISRRTENGVSGTGQKTSSLRFVTHPPQTKTSVHEGGSVDSNGLGSLKAQERAFPSDPSKLGPQESNLSLTDSHISGADSDFDSSYSEVVQGATSDGSDPDKFEKRNGKSLKQKSKSDPSGAKARDGVELPDSPKSSHTQSAPDIGEEKRESSGLPEFKVTEDEAKCRSEDVLSKHGTEVSPERETETPTSYTVSHDPLTSGRESGNDPGDSLSPRELHTRYGGYSHSPSPSRTDSGRPKRRYASPSSTKSPSAPSHDRSYPFTEKNHPYTLLLSVPPPRKPILRSASSASVLQRDRRGYYSPAPSYIKDTEPVRKYSATTDEPPSASALRSGTSVPEFPPSIGDSVGALATSMPDVWQQTPPPMTPETDIPYQFFKDKRYHIVEELYRNEKEYVDALKTLKDKYMSPLKSQNVLDESVVDHIFYMVPEILIHHSIYLDFLDKVWKNWDSRNSTVGNIIVSIFSKQTVLDSYLSFVENYKSSGKVIESALLTKSSVSKFLDLCQRESGSKLTIKDLIVRPIQRIPRYELLLQRLIENTPKNHPDAPLLQEAEKVMHDLAVKIGTATESKQEEDMQETLKKLEMLLVTELNAPDRTYLRHDMVQISNKKDMCCVWLFSDVLIISSVKRKSGPVTRKVSIILKTPYGQDYAENIKHKTWLRVGLDDIEILKSSLSRWPTFDKEQVEDDLVLLNQMNELCTQLQCNHQMLDEALKDLMSSLNDQLSDYQTRNPSSESNKLELLVTTQEGVLHLLVIFASPEKRAVWEATFSDAKLKLSLLSDKRAPEFLQPLQITKTRAGMQFSCAAPIDGLNANGYRDVWVCNSDGYVGHMCLLSLQPEPIVTLNTPVPGCNARILCICAVPAFNGPFRRKGSNKSYRQRTTSGRVSPHVTIECPETASYGGDEDGYQSDSESSDDDPIAFKANREDDTLLKESEPLPSPVTSEPMTTTGSWTQDPHKSTMWLGTEDGCIHIFQCTDNIKTTKNKLKIQHGASVYCIVYLDNKVFLSLANGIVVVYRRDQDGFWVTDAPIIRCLGSANAPITKMLAVAGKMWCGCQQNIFVVNPGTLKTECSFTVTPESSVQCLVTSGQGVWIACQQSARVLLYHATSYEYLLEVSVAQAVSQKLQSADDIIRQHKAACLRITALLICKDLLWVGTSAGVILTIPIPKITSTTTRGTLTVPAVTGLVYGHTGHVRFLTTIEMPTTSSQKLEINSSDEQANENLSLSDIQRRASMATPATMATRMLIISGGDGYEDFRNNASNEAAGRDDSTNHLLLWQV